MIDKKIIYDVLPLFSKPLYTSNLQLNKKENDLISHYLKKETFNNSGINDKKNLSNNISKGSKSLNVLENKKLNFLKIKILKHFDIYKNTILNYENTNFLISSSWFTKTSMSESGNFHNHSNCMFSGVFYINVNKESGDISFESFNNNNFLLIPTKYNIYNSKEISLTPNANDIFIFPSELHHRIEVNKSNSTRYSLAFNLFPYGKIGIKDSLVDLKVNLQ
jgi:uncharacterized protein (TIGR02466 family)